LHGPHPTLLFDKKRNDMKTTAASLLVLTLFAGIGIAPAMAQGAHTPAIDRAQQDIGARIQQGLRSGMISPSEAQDLFRRQRDIQIRESRIKSDGVATPRERQMLRQDLDDLNAEVERKIAHSRGDAQGADRTPGIDDSQAEIRDRIEQGVRSGRISRFEARRLEERERNIARNEARFKADGVVTQQERRQLRSDLASLRQDVERMMRNGRGR
jgi:hypothetical protein